MVWMRLFALLIAVASIQVTADGSKKKIRIHLPQKVKHIHHHKKIYITNHHASSSQYAPAYLPNAEGAMAVPTNVALPSVSNVLPLNSVELFDESRFPAGSPAASKILPLYHTRGYYGPKHNEWEETDYDPALPSESNENSYTPSSYSATPSGPPSTSNHSAKRVKIIKLNEQSIKKPNRKPKPKRPVRARPPAEDEHPVSKFHEHFYSDLDGSGTIKKVKKPQRVEKIIDGDTEHIHTYSEEHIHKLVFDDESKIGGVVGIDTVGSNTINSAHPLLPLKNSLIAIPSNSFAGFAVGSLGTPSQFEYSAYNPRDVTHDHIFHDHGEIPPNMDLSRDPIGLPPKGSYTSQGFRINESGLKRYKNKYFKATKATPINGLGYYESLYAPVNGLNKPSHNAVSHYESSLHSNIDNLRPIPSFDLLGKPPKKVRSTYSKAKEAKDNRLHGSSPISVSSTIIHDYHPKPTYPGALPPSSFSNYRDPIVNFKDSYSNNYDTYASSSNLLYAPEENRDSNQNIQGKQKSISTQNINFGGQDRQRMTDNGDDGTSLEMFHDEPSAFEDDPNYNKNKGSDSISPTPYTIKTTSPAHLYYTAMAIKALYDEPASMPEASNDNLQYAEAPPQSTTPFAPTVATTIDPPELYFAAHDANAENPESTHFISGSENRLKKRHRSSTPIIEHNSRPVIPDLRTIKEFDTESRPSVLRKSLHHHRQILEPAIESGAKGKLKYGDKI